jgi:hypothetical protein
MMTAPITNMTAATVAAIATWKMLGWRRAGEADDHRTERVLLG